MPLTNFPNGISSFGIPVMGGGGMPATKGKVYFVDYGNGSNGNSGTRADDAWQTIAWANSKVKTNNFDVVCLIGNATHVLTAMETISKNRVIWIGLDGSPGRRYGQAAKVSMGVTTAATDIGAVKNTGVRNVFQNIKFMSANTKDESLYSFVDGGEFMQMNSCEIYKSTDLDVTGAAELACNGDSSEYNNCYIGSTANAISGAIIRPCVTFTKALAGSGKVARDVVFRNTIFARKCGNAANNFLYGLDANCIERMCLIEDSVFYNALLGTTPDETIEFGSDQTAGSVLVKNSTAINVTGIASTGQGVYVYGPDSSATASCIAIAAT